MATIFSLNVATYSLEWYCLVVPFIIYRRPKWPNTTIFGNFQQKNIVSEINSKVPLFLELEFQKFEFLISFATVALLSWIYAIKKNFAVLELGKLEYHLHSTRVYRAHVPFKKIKKKIYTVLELGKLEYCVIFFFFLFGDKQQINIKIKISSFFMFLFI